MLNPLNFISKFIKSGNKKELDRIGKIVDQINLLEENIKKLNDKQFPEKTIKLKEEIKNRVKEEIIEQVEKSLGVTVTEEDLETILQCEPEWITSMANTISKDTDLRWFVRVR